MRIWKRIVVIYYRTHVVGGQLIGEGLTEIKIPSAGGDFFLLPVAATTQRGQSPRNNKIVRANDSATRNTKKPSTGTGLLNGPARPAIH